MIYIVRKSTPRFTRFPSFVLIRLVLTEVERFKNVKINKEMYGIRALCQTASGWPCISLLILTFSNGCISLTFGSIYTKLEDFVKLGLHFVTIRINSWLNFSPVMWSKLKIITVEWMKSRIWDTIDDWFINIVTKNRVFAVFHSWVICRSVPPKFIELCMETPCLCPLGGHKHGGHKVTKTSVIEFCYWNEKWLL